jgi:hypothetical protein
MKSHKRLLLVGMIVAVTALTGAASASAAVWKDAGVNVGSAISIGLSGGEVFESGTSGMSCGVKATLTTSGGSTGTITKWEITSCAGGFGELAKCEILASEPKTLPWTVDVNTTDISVTNMRTRHSFKAGCPIKELDKTIANMTMTPDLTTAITQFEFTGTNGTYKQFGSVSVDAPNSGTYGIG